jgi:ribosomal protein S18 acetylase RimI-like enzyme
VTTDHALLAAIDACYDAIPRPRSDPQPVGPFTLFVAHPGVRHGYYARPSLNATLLPTVDDVRRLLARQRELDAPRSIEWIDEIAPTLDLVAHEVGYEVRRHPLMALEGDARGASGLTRLVDPDDHDLLVEARAAVSVAFEHEGTARGEVGVDVRDQARPSQRAALTDSYRAELRAGRLVVAATFADDDPQAGAVGGGTLLLAGAAAEIAGVGVLPAYRRRGLAGQIASALGREARRRGADIVFCSADSDDVARVYARVGFRRVGTAVIASAPS